MVRCEGLNISGSFYRNKCKWNAVVQHDNWCNSSGGNSSNNSWYGCKCHQWCAFIPTLLEQITALRKKEIWDDKETSEPTSHWCKSTVICVYTYIAWPKCCSEKNQKEIWDDMIPYCHQKKARTKTWTNLKKNYFVLSGSEIGLYWFRFLGQSCPKKYRHEGVNGHRQINLPVILQFCVRVELCWNTIRMLHVKSTDVVVLLGIGVTIHGMGVNVIHDVLSYLHCLSKSLLWEEEKIWDDRDKWTNKLLHRVCMLCFTEIPLHVQHLQVNWELITNVGFCCCFQWNILTICGNATTLTQVVVHTTSVLQARSSSMLWEVRLYTT